MKLVITGSRIWTDHKFVFEQLSLNHSVYNFTQLLSGHCRGVDQFAEDWAYQNNVSVKLFPADWNKFGKQAGAIRNVQMVKEADILIAFCSSIKSAGTEMTIQKMRQENKLCIVYYKPV